MNKARIKLGNLSVGFVHGLADAISHCGHNPQPLFDSYGLTPGRLAEPRARLSIPRFMRLGQSAIELSNEPALGLLMGRYARFSHLGLAGITAAQAPSLGEAARTITRFEALYAANYRGQSSFHEDADGAWLRFYSISPYNAYNRFVVDSVLSSWLQLLKQLTDQPVTIEKAQIEFSAPDYADRYAEFFNCQTEFCASHNQLRLTRQSLDLANPEHCPGTWKHLLEICENELEQLTRTRNLSERTTQILGSLLQGCEPDLEQVAGRLNLPPWTLRRRLADEGTQFRTLLNDTRRDLAVAYIRDTELSFGEIAYLLGFASAEAFQRAFKRWNQQTPGEYRREQRRAQ